MKCSKCGEEYKENQAFCLKCGSPIQVMPDFNLIEAELASNIGELMNSMEKENPSEDVSDDLDITVDNMDMELKLFDFYKDDDNGKTKVIGKIPPTVIKKEVPIKEEPKKKKSKKKNVIIFTSIGIILVSAILLFAFLASKIDEGSKSYDYYFKEATNYYDDKDGSDALSSALIALKKADTKDEKIKIRKLIDSIYILNKDKNEDYISNLSKLIELKVTNAEYYKRLSEYYYKEDKMDLLSDLLRTIEKEDILKELEKYIVPIPTADTKEGEYSSFFELSLTSLDGTKIIYTDDSTDPVANGKEYSSKIEIKTEGENTIKAIAVNEAGISSKVLTLKYTINLDAAKAPKITPTGGAYTESTDITLELLEGSKAYYTWDGKEPTEESELYTDKIIMKRGINVLKVVVIDKYGLKSDIAEESYNLQIPRQITVNQSVDIIKDAASKEATLTVADKESLQVSYDTTKIINNEEYFIIIAKVLDAAGLTKIEKIYGINTVSKEVKLDITVKDGEYIAPEEVKND